MESWVPIAVSALALVGTVYGQFSARRKVDAEAKAQEAESVDTYNQVILRQLHYLEEALGETRKQHASLEKEVRAYQKQIREALVNEGTLRAQVEKLNRAVIHLRDYILSQGLTPPAVDLPILDSP